MPPPPAYKAATDIEFPAMSMRAQNQIKSANAKNEAPTPTTPATWLPRPSAPAFRLAVLEFPPVGPGAQTRNTGEKNQPNAITSSASPAALKRPLKSAAFPPKQPAAAGSAMQPAPPVPAATVPQERPRRRKRAASRSPSPVAPPSVPAAPKPSSSWREKEKKPEPAAGPPASSAASAAPTLEASGNAKTKARNARRRRAKQRAKATADDDATPRAQMWWEHPRCSTLPMLDSGDAPGNGLSQCLSSKKNPHRHKATALAVKTRLRSAHPDGEYEGLVLSFWKHDGRAHPVFRVNGSARHTVTHSCSTSDVKSIRALTMQAKKQYDRWRAPN